ncbi:MAG TPA: type II 3-dehydroquinate dehydratase [Sphingomicrobium sp.]|nr:type II 3-dehydroquinate dehydratase [Sphingomicrobium sp.]
MSKPIFVLNGPNLNLLGQREPDLYGTETLSDIHHSLETLAGELGLAVDFRQSNHEGELIDWLHEARNGASAVIINAGGYTHTSISLRDAVAALRIPIIEVHLSNIYARESFRRKSYLSEVVQGTIAGLGAQGYSLALQAAASLARASTPDSLKRMSIASS